MTYKKYYSHIKKNGLKLVFAAVIFSMLCILPGCTSSSQENKSQADQGQDYKALISLQPVDEKSFTELFGVEYRQWKQNSEQAAVPPEMPKRYFPKMTVNEPGLPENPAGVINADRFPSVINNWEQFVEDRFIIEPNKHLKFHYPYEENFYCEIGSYITTDVVLHHYHELFDCVLRTIEQEKLYPAVQLLTEGMLGEAVAQYEEFVNLEKEDSEENQKQEEALLRNIAYFSVARQLLWNDSAAGQNEKVLEIYPPVKERVQEELLNIKNLAPSISAIFKNQRIDYSQLKVRGHYTLSPKLSSYFQGMKWYGHIAFPVTVLTFDNSGNPSYKMDEMSLRQAVAISRILSDPENAMLSALWEAVYCTTAALVGNADGLTYHQLAKMVLDVTGNEINSLALTDWPVAEFYQYALDNLPEPQIKHQTQRLSSGKQFRFMGERYILDSEILQETSHFPERRFPSNLDVAYVLGSDIAYKWLEKGGHFLLNVDQHYNVLDLQGNIYEATYPAELRMDPLPGSELWRDYPKNLYSLRDKVEELPESFWTATIYNGWLDTFRLLVREDRRDLPAYMRTTAWKTKDLNSMLGSWVELRRDTILYAKASVAEAGGPLEELDGYVEPRAEVYQNVLWLTESLEQILNRFNLNTEAMRDYLNAYRDMVEKIHELALKEIKGEEFTEEDKSFIRFFGGTLEHLIFMAYSTTDGITMPEEDAVIADVHTSYDERCPETGMVLEEAVGRAGSILVLIPLDGKWHVLRGAVYTPFEFVSTQRFNDEEWQNLLREGKSPPIPEWLQTISVVCEQEVLS